MHKLFIKNLLKHREVRDSKWDRFAFDRILKKMRGKNWSKDRERERVYVCEREREKERERERVYVCERE